MTSSLIYKDLDTGVADESDAAICLREIEAMVSGFNLDDYARATDKQTYILSKVTTATRFKMRLVDSEIIPKIEQIINYYNSNKDIEPIVSQQEDPVFIVEAFRKILAMNVVSFGDKPLAGEFSGINGSEIIAGRNQRALGSSPPLRVRHRVKSASKKARAPKPIINLNDQYARGIFGV